MTSKSVSSIFTVRATWFCQLLQYVQHTSCFQNGRRRLDTRLCCPVQTVIEFSMMYTCVACIKGMESCRLPHHLQHAPAELQLLLQSAQDLIMHLQHARHVYSVASRDFIATNTCICLASSEAITKRQKRLWRLSQCWGPANFSIHVNHHDTWQRASWSFCCEEAETVVQSQLYADVTQQILGYCTFSTAVRHKQNAKQSKLMYDPFGAMSAQYQYRQIHIQQFSTCLVLVGLKAMQLSVQYQHQSLRLTLHAAHHALVLKGSMLK